MDEYVIDPLESKSLSPITVKESPPENQTFEIKPELMK